MWLGIGLWWIRPLKFSNQHNYLLYRSIFVFGSCLVPFWLLWYWVTLHWVLWCIPHWPHCKICQIPISVRSSYTCFSPCLIFFSLSLSLFFCLGFRLIRVISSVCHQWAQITKGLKIKAVRLTDYSDYPSTWFLN